MRLTATAVVHLDTEYVTVVPDTQQEPAAVRYAVHGGVGREIAHAQRHVLGTVPVGEAPEVRRTVRQVPGGGDGPEVAGVELVALAAARTPRRPLSVAASTVTDMATLPNPLPRLASLGLQLPPGGLVDDGGTAHALEAVGEDDGSRHEPLLWLTDGRAAPGGRAALQQTAPAVGLLPVVLDVGSGHGGPELWELMPSEMSYPGDHDAEEVLEEFWDEYAEEDTDWPGLADTPRADAAADPESVASDIVDSLLDGGGPLKDPRLALVPARRSADIPTAIGWTGPANHEGDTARLSAVLRSWEDRFGIRVVALGFDHLLVSVAAPPTTLVEAEALAAEHFAFCPDNIWQGSDATLTAYAEHQLLNQQAWHFWWD